MTFPPEILGMLWALMTLSLIATSVVSDTSKIRIIYATTFTAMAVLTTFSLLFILKGCAG